MFVYTGKGPGEEEGWGEGSRGSREDVGGLLMLEDFRGVEDGDVEF